MIVNNKTDYWININVQTIKRFEQYIPSSVNRGVGVVKVGSIMNRVRERKKSWYEQ